MISKKASLYMNIKGHIENYLNSNDCSVPFDYEGLRGIIYNKSFKDNNMKVIKSEINVYNDIQKYYEFKYVLDNSSNKSEFVIVSTEYLQLLPEYEFNEFMKIYKKHINKKIDCPILLHTRIVPTRKF